MTYSGHHDSLPVAVTTRARKLGWSAIGIVVFIVGVSGFF
jgi:hypothetical protein